MSIGCTRRRDRGCGRPSWRSSIPASYAFSTRFDSTRSVSPARWIICCYAVAWNESKNKVSDDGRLDAELAAIIPFQQVIIDFEERRRLKGTMDPAKAATTLAKLNTDLAGRARHRTSKANAAALNRAAMRLSQLRTVLRSWYALSMISTTPSSAGGWTANTRKPMKRSTAWRRRYTPRRAFPDR